jgi:hypothetical protein
VKTPEETEEKQTEKTVPEILAEENLNPFFHSPLFLSVIRAKYEETFCMKLSSS